jgi:ubiquinone/menaquinone biosynthesis C-methylase UbiE
MPSRPAAITVAFVVAAAFFATPLAPPAKAQEPSVRPGANQQYRDTDISAWIRRFEGAGREIFDNRHAIVEKSGIRPGMKVADVGAGTGLFALLFAEAVGPSGRVYAVDIIPKFLEHTAARARKAGLRNVETRLGDERSLPLPEASVDVLFLCDTYHHFEYPRSMNASMFRALRPGGTLVLIDFVRIPGKTPRSTLEHVRAGVEVFTKELEAAGFEKVEEAGGQNPPVPLLKENYFVRFRKPPQHNGTPPKRNGPPESGVTR